MKEKTVKARSKNATKFVSQRMHGETKKCIEAKLKLINSKPFGRKVKADQLLHMAISLVTDEQIKLLQDQSMTFEDRKELLRQRYIETRGPISKDEFTGFMLTGEFQEFLASHRNV